MAQVAIIIGNGFDLDLKLKSKYSDFMESQEFQEIYKNSRLSFREGEVSLLDFLLELSLKSNWFDMEAGIHDFISKKYDFKGSHLGLVRNEFEMLKEALYKYLTRVSCGFKADEKRLPCQFINNLTQCPWSMVEIYFNYTNPRTFMQHPTYYDLGMCTFTYVHGSLHEGEIVLGCDIQPDEKVNRTLSYMYKYNMLHRANHVARNLLEATEIIFYGHSVNEMDFCYFREFFKVASASPYPIRHLTFITLDENSERDIKDNIRNQGISVTNLYSNLSTFEFIHTSKIYNGDMREIRKWEALFSRLLDKNRADLQIKQ